MKDFIKIFFVLIVIVIAFVSGRNYGEKSIIESKDYKNTLSQQDELTKSEEELKNTKEKLQSLLDSSDLKKADELYGKMMTIFLVDLGLRISEAKQKDLDEGKAKLAMCSAPINPRAMDKKEITPTPAVTKSPELVEEKAKSWTRLDLKKFKSTEWLLQNSNSDYEIRKNLENLRIKSLDAYLVNAPETSFAAAEKFIGSYRGAVIDVTGKNYGSLVINLNGRKDNKNQDEFVGDIKLYRQGKEESSSVFTTNTLGYTPTGFSGVVISFGKRFLQVYKIQNAEKISGYFYERAPNGTTTVIGSFVLNRTDRM